MFVLVLVLLVLSFISIVLRCYARISIRGFGWDDWLMIMAFVRRIHHLPVLLTNKLKMLFTASVVPLYYCVLAALGVEERYLTVQDEYAANHVCSNSSSLKRIFGPQLT